MIRSVTASPLPTGELQISVGVFNEKNYARNFKVAANSANEAFSVTSPPVNGEFVLVGAGETKFFHLSTEKSNATAKDYEPYFWVLLGEKGANPFVLQRVQATIGKTGIVDNTALGRIAFERFNAVQTQLSEANREVEAVRSEASRQNVTGAISQTLLLALAGVLAFMLISR